MKTKVSGNFSVKELLWGMYNYAWMLSMGVCSTFSMEGKLLGDFLMGAKPQQSTQNILKIYKFSDKDTQRHKFEIQKGASAPIATPGDAHDAEGFNMTT